jgi:hypothetical protein
MSFRSKPHLSIHNGYWLCRCEKGNVGESADFFWAYMEWMMARIKIS